jgi:hypothetical protein
MDKSIGVFVYSFQNKDLIAMLTDIVNKSSGQNNLCFYVIDQNNVERSRLFDIDSKHVKIIYKHTKWDSIKSPVAHKFDGSRILACDYFMQCGDGIEMSKDWDINLVNKMESVRYKDQTIISGNHKLEYKNKNLFMVEKVKVDSEDYASVKMIDRDFIFCLSTDIKWLGYPTDLKYYGEEEKMSIDIHNKHYNLICAPTAMFTNKTIPLENHGYVPFSLTHKYNDFVKENDKNIRGLLGLDIKPLPFDNDDIAYVIDKSETDKIGGERYLNRTRIIN